MANYKTAYDSMQDVVRRHLDYINWKRKYDYDRYRDIWTKQSDDIREMEEEIERRRREMDEYLQREEILVSALKKERKKPKKKAKKKPAKKVKKKPVVKEPEKIPTRLESVE